MTIINNTIEQSQHPHSLDTLGRHKDYGSVLSQTKELQLLPYFLWISADMPLRCVTELSVTTYWYSFNLSHSVLRLTSGCPECDQVHRAAQSSAR